LYSRLTNLDNQFSNVTRLQSPIICLNIYDDTLIVFTYDLHIMLYGLDKKDAKPGRSIEQEQEGKYCSCLFSSKCISR